MKRVLGLVTALLLGVSLLASAGPAAASETVEIDVVDQVKPDNDFFNPNAWAVSDVSKTKGVVRYSNPLDVCRALNTTLRCAFSDTYSASITISVDVGLTRADVATTLGISSSRSRSVSVQCEATVRKGYKMVAYPTGTSFRYRFKKVTLLGTQYTGWKYAFYPNGGVACGVYKA